MLKQRFPEICKSPDNTQTIIDLLRHGETVGGSRFRGSIDDALTENGWSQMDAAIAQEMKNHSQTWHRIISSPLQRCADFAHKLGQKHSLPVSLDSRFKEMHFGRWEGRTAAELMSIDEDALTQFWNDPVQNTPPEAEPLLEFAQRVLSAWTDLLRDYQGERILLVTHGGVMRVLLCHVQQRPIKQLLEIEVKHAALKQLRIPE
ncbi:MAG: alpha-ribazole phosphatase family protein [Gammaproteobacteria bacterium]|nr:alpha-ribazole phosphatase family protein [Gammaproteobacteria bacterium]MCF6260373.1 alpha-ribazole phosphatase family protein [Gammaproteobacteria bacterium]